MNYKKTLSSYNEQIKNWSFEKEQLLECFRLLSERNILIAGNKPIIDFCPGCETPSKNTTFIEYEQSNPDHLAFHVGFPHQKRLYPLVEKRSESPFNIGVFFSFDPKDLAFLFDYEDRQEEMTYFLDSTCAKEARVQTNYSSGVISRYDLDDLLGTRPAIDQDPLRKRIQELNEKWIIDNTVTFNIDEISEIKEKHYIWLIVPGPVDVQY